MHGEWALLSVSNKDGLDVFARKLISLGYQLLGPAGTVKYLTGCGITVRDVAEFVGRPILGHKVVTLSRELHAALLADRTTSELAELSRINMDRIELVYVDLYPLQAEIAKQDATPASVRRLTDIGGSTMLRSAAKGERIVIADKTDIPHVLRYLERSSYMDKSIRRRFLAYLAAKAEKVASEYAAASAAYQLKQAGTTNPEEIF